jgi:signal transduction histidine kinase
MAAVWNPHRKQRARYPITSCLSWTDVVIAVALSAAPVAVATGALSLSHGQRHPGVAACLAVIALTLPVAWRRPWPLTAAAVMAIGAVVNGLAFGHVVRCGVALPAVYLVAFAIAARVGWPRVAVGLALCAADVVVEGYYDPQIGWSGIPFVLVLLVAFIVLGALLRARNRTAEALRAKSAQLRQQREETARLAVLVDRTALSADIEGTLHGRLGVIADTAAAGLSSVADPAADPAAAAEEATRALAAIERDGRAALGQLREVVGALRPSAADPSAPAQPQPTLARLPELLSGLPSARATLIIEGQPRPLPAGLELSGYRIVEHLVEALEDEALENEALAVLEVRLAYYPEALELHVTGATSTKTTDLRAVLAAARQRAVLHGGTVEGRVAGGVCSATARLPLVSGYA